jgi:hypothetical protein
MTPGVCVSKRTKYLVNGDQKTTEFQLFESIFSDDTNTIASKHDRI